MMALLQTWLFSLTAVSLLLAVAEALVTQESIRRVLRLAGGVLMILVLLRPVAQIDLEDLALSLEDYRREAEELRETYQTRQQEDLAAGIEEELASYIWDKARELGLDCQVRVSVEAGAEGALLPSAVAVDAPYNAELSAVIQEELGVPREKQTWREAS